MAVDGGDTLKDLSKDKCVNPRAQFYKKPIRKDNYNLDVDNIDSPQEIRRQQLLQHQKKSRDAAFNIGRGLVEEAFNSEDENDNEMEVDRHKEYKVKKYKNYGNRLMLSEWMLEVPQDFLEKWTMVPCPIGQRTQIIACKGSTKAFNRRGLRLGKFSSALPGGNSENQRNSCTILDCIWVKELKTYYALDILAWSNQTFLNCEAEFRLFWLNAQLQDIKVLKEREYRVNSFPILPLPQIPCDQNLSELLNTIHDLPTLDGLLFYHREGLYTCGRSPLVTWLKSFMLPEVLGIRVPPPFDEKPDGYIDFKHYIQSSTAKRKKGKLTESKMEVVEVNA
ncbi:snurportin-1 [Orussus abietinus]|uniref:snurportin-1 n=1 Tax=Orussus abietinus TaxID=222816 RepID=UPI0006265C20|nr:snurportin-1 [Orussus abietinus]